MTSKFFSLNVALHDSQLFTIHSAECHVSLHHLQYCDILGGLFLQNYFSLFLRGMKNEVDSNNNNSGNENIVYSLMLQV